MSADFSTETLQSRRDWHEIIQSDERQNKDPQPKLLYPAKLPFRIKKQIKNFSDKKKIKEFITTKSVLQEMLKGLL